jgi:hypothetical protein
MRATCIDYIDMEKFSLRSFSDVSVSFACRNLLETSWMDICTITPPRFLVHLLLLPPLHHCPSPE